MIAELQVTDAVQLAREELARRSLTEDFFDGTETVLHDAQLVVSSNWAATLGGGEQFCFVCGSNGHDVTQYRCEEHSDYRIVWVHHTSGGDRQQSTSKQLRHIAGLEIAEPWFRDVPTDVDPTYTRLHWWARLRRGYHPCSVCGEDALWSGVTRVRTVVRKLEHFCDEHVPRSG